MRPSAFSAVFAICVGVMMIVMWAVFIALGQVPQFADRPAEITLHLIDEFATATLLLITGVLALRGLKWASVLLLTALGMLLYTLVASPGYYLQSGAIPMVAMFAALLVLAIVAVALQARTLQQRLD